MRPRSAGRSAAHLGRAQRNVIAHGYAVLDYGRLFRTVTHDLPGLIERLERIVIDLERGLN